MEDEPISQNEAEHRGRKLVKRLNEHDIKADKELLVETAKHHSSSYPPRKLFQTAIEVGVGDREPPEFQEESTDSQSNPERQQEQLEPFEALVEQPIPTTLFEKLEGKESIQPIVGRFETPPSMEDIVYIVDQDAFENEFSTEPSRHSIQAAACAAVEHNWESIISMDQAEMSNCLDELSNSTENSVLSQAVIRASKRVEPDPNKDALRSSPVWPVIKKRLCQPLLGEIQRSNQELLSRNEIAELVPFKQMAVHRAIRSLVKNDTLEETSRGIRYSGDETSFDQENAQRWTEGN